MKTKTSPLKIIKYLNKICKFTSIHHVLFDKNENIIKLNTKTRFPGLIMSILSIYVIYRAVSNFYHKVGFTNFIIIQISNFIIYTMYSLACICFWMKSSHDKYKETSDFIKNMKKIDGYFDFSITYNRVFVYINAISIFLNLLALVSYLWESFYLDRWGFDIGLYVYWIIITMNFVTVMRSAETELMQIQVLKLNEEIEKILEKPSAKVFDKIQVLTKACEKIINNLNIFNNKFGLSVSTYKKNIFSLCYLFFTEITFIIHCLARYFLLK